MGRALKEFLENLMNTEMDLFLMDNHGQIKEYSLDQGRLFGRKKTNSPYRLLEFYKEGHKKELKLQAT